MAFLLLSELQAKNNYLVREKVSHKKENNRDSNGE